VLFSAARRRGGTIVEIGSYLGASASFLAAGLRQSHHAGRVYCVDTWQNDAMSEGRRDTWAEFQRNVADFLDVIVPIRADSVEAAASFETAVDLLFVDGDHSYEGCRRDVAAWLPKLRADGWIFMHDAGWAEGVLRVIEELVVPHMARHKMVCPNLWWGCRRAE
jgi:predicted O-methyltransferase YrrM